MKELILNQIPSIVRWLLALLGAYFATKNFGEFEQLKEIDYSGTIMSIVASVLAMLISLGLKKASESGANGKLAMLVVGPRVEHIAHSLARFALAAISGSLAAWLKMDQEQLGSATAEELIVAVIFASFAIDRGSKAIKP